MPKKVNVYVKVYVQCLINQMKIKLWYLSEENETFMTQRLRFPKGEATIRGVLRNNYNIRYNIYNQVLKTGNHLLQQKCK